MPVSYFVFTVFVFLLLVAFVFLAKKIWTRGAPNAARLADKEAKVFRLYQHVEDLTDGLEEYVDEVTTDISREKEQIAAIVESAVLAEKSIKLMANEARELLERQQAAYKTDQIPPSVVAYKTKNSISKNEKILALHEEGMSIDQITKELGLGKGEVALVLHLDETAKNM